MTPTLSWPRIIALVAAAAWLGGAVGYFVSTTRDGGTDPVDVGFLQDMSSHHRQAMDLALIGLDTTETPAVRAIAREVLIGQSYEIGRMDQQLRTLGQDPLDRPEVAMAWMGMPSAVEAMPGMATPEQLTALREADGAEADVLFLELMAAHHAGGVHMADAAAEDARSPGLRDFASRLADNQRAEVQEMILLVEQDGIDAHLTPIAPRR